MNCFRAPVLIMLIMVFSISLDLVFSQTFTKCVLDINISSSSSEEACTNLGSNWDGFLTQPCCGLPFNRYLRALSRWTNQTGLIFLNSTQQRDCLSLMNNSSYDNFICGIEKLTSSAGGCSDYSDTDIVNDLGSRLKSLRDDCRLMDSEGGCTKEFLMRVGLTKSFIAFGDNSLPLASSADESGSETRHRTKFKTDLWILIGGVVGIVVVIIATLWILLKRKTEVKPSSGRYISDESYSGESSYRGLSLKEIYSATDNFSMSNFIGQGIAGKVYKGILADRQHVAIKHIIKDEQMETFVREVTSLSHLKHPNLESLLGHYDGPNECFLVYELCHNGNLSEWLFGSIVHRDIKPANILLSASFEAKLSDFGLSKIISIGHSYASSEVRGTFGYVDPEYQKNRQVNSYGDVYSFGIVLIQLLSGQRAKNLTKGGNIKEFADSKLEGKFSMESFELVLKLALTSIGLKQQRPSMEQVVVKLEEALDLSTRVESVHP
ncbi:hypothetical protein RND71_003148 [Anisodus tanguticus]|uniref:Protein kinase domain-containing protein n=1 Tax=Anisodus tanguticus TaxID=243964 RepID=A0AAE1VPP9_9SOLA|nr:hypothetical protein RND71_003148 [Anisodus tanguticus]